jgi:hypothetical protein
MISTGSEPSAGTLSTDPEADVRFAVYVADLAAHVERRGLPGVAGRGAGDAERPVRHLRPPAALRCPVRRGGPGHGVDHVPRRSRAAAAARRLDITSPGHRTQDTLEVLR